MNALQCQHILVLVYFIHISRFTLYISISPFQYVSHSTSPCGGVRSSLLCSFSEVRAVRETHSLLQNRVKCRSHTHIHTCTPPPPHTHTQTHIRIYVYLSISLCLSSVFETMYSYTDIHNGNIYKTVSINCTELKLPINSCKMSIIA